MSTAVACRRKHRRYSPPETATAEVRFGYPRSDGAPCVMRLRDLSASGLSFIINRDLPGFEIGRSINGASLAFGATLMHGDLLVMRLTPDAGPGSVCGALFFPRDDEDIIALQRLVADLERAVD